MERDLLLGGLRRAYNFRLGRRCGCRLNGSLNGSLDHVARSN
jgi:hypothetical protein